MAIPERSIMQLTYRYEVNGQTLLNVLHFTNLIAYPTADIVSATQGLADAWATATGSGTVNGAMRAVQGANVTYRLATAQFIYPTRFIRREHVMSVTGGLGSACTAQNVAAVITKRADIAARPGVGSFHLGGLGSDAYSGGLLLTGTLLNMDIVADELLDGISESEQSTAWSPCIANRTKTIIDNKTHYVLTGSTLLLECKAQKELRTMRRRTYGVGI